MLRALSLLTFCLLPATAFAADQAGIRALDDEAYLNSRNGVIQLICENEATGQVYLSRAVVLDIPGFAGDFDILLAARHAVMDRTVERNCHVRGEPLRRGQIAGIETSSPAVNDFGEFSQDWAIVRTRGRLDDSISRLRAAAYAGREQGQLSMLRAAMHGEPCQITPAPDQIVEPTLIFHDCYARPGLSGSPLLAQIEGEAYVIGVQLGEYVMFNEGGRQYSVGRRLDDEFLQALIDFIAEESGG
ncbi:hypothetical protein [uncultured Maricaulis sp.]|uniref:trypsin-like serine peptidase n=1 Tax=uncultured Maricaulis sp. TaxID=174710 RepID=UPI0030DBC410